jgi:hypothetical protein
VTYRLRESDERAQRPRNRREAQLGGALGVALCAFLFSSGCVSMAGDQLADIEPRAPGTPPPAIEQTVGDFSFHLDGGKMITSTKAGRNVNQMVLARWKKRGFITRETYVKSSMFTGNADYNLTLGGHQEGDSSVVMQFLSGLTLFLFPYSVNTHLDLTYSLEHVESGRIFEAQVADSFRLVTQLLLLPVTPFAMGGAARTYERIGDHVYDQFVEQGAFDPDSWPADPIDDPEMSDGESRAGEIEDARPLKDRLRTLQRLHDEGVISDDEYDTGRREILRDL